MLVELDKKQKTVCGYCFSKNQKLESELKQIMSRVNCRTLFVTWNECLDEFVVFTGGSNMSDEFDCYCLD